MIADSRVQAWHRALLVGSVASVSIAAWLVLWRYGAPLHAPVHHHDGTGSGFALLFVGSWTIMTIAMMLPTSIPLVATYQAIAGNRPDTWLLTSLVIAGYLAIWAVVGLAFYAAGSLLQQLAGANPWLHDWNAAAGGLLLIVAGAYQFTPLKYRCLDKCRSPLSFVLGYWQGQRERRNAFRLGAHHGLFCVGCCWALMALMFVVGVGNVAGMLLLGAVMAVEKNVSWGRRISAPLGVLLVAGGAAMIAAA